MSNVAKKSRIGLAAAAAFALAAGCGDAVQGSSAHMGRLAEERSKDFDPNNGLFSLSIGMGIELSYSGFSYNGMPASVLTVNGIGPSGVSTDDFAAWFGSDPATADVVMKYVVRCALPSGEEIDYDYGGVHYSWLGTVGLAPVWAADYPIPEIEQQLITACLAAHANKYGAHVPITVLGRMSDDVPLPADGQQLADYPITEGCFFGNVFQAQGAFSGTDRPEPLDASQSSSRACALADATDPNGLSQCPPIQYVGSCRDVCQPSDDGTFYDSCEVNGVVYRPLTTRNKTTSIYTCGDGICDPTEHCGTGTTPDSCYLDCGACE
jgi:hypothetical protein